jgi:hypothetical protein
MAVRTVQRGEKLPKKFDAWLERLSDMTESYFHGPGDARPAPGRQPLTLPAFLQSSAPGRN